MSHCIWGWASQVWSYFPSQHPLLGGFDDSKLCMADTVRLLCRLYRFNAIVCDKAVRVGKMCTVINCGLDLYRG